MLMLEKIKNNTIIKTIFSSRNVGMYLFLIISLSVAWSTARIIQKNYELQKQIVSLSQEVAVQEQENINQRLRNQYYATDAFLELAARRYFLKSFPGERMYAVPKDVALANTKPEPENIASAKKNAKQYPFIIKNWQAWINFFQGKQNQPNQG